MNENPAWKSVFDRTISTPRGNLLGALAALVLASAYTAVVRVVSGSVVAAGPLDPLLIVFVLLPVTGLMYVSLALLCIPAKSGLGMALGVAAVAFLLLGGLAVLVGVPGYVPPGEASLLFLWPGQYLWLHGCFLPTGAWPCPPG